MVYGMEGLLPGILRISLPDTIVLPPAFLTWQTLLFAFICYLYGSISFSLIFTRLFKKQDLSRKGTGNIGVANAFGVGGLRAGFSTVAGEASKVALPLLLSHFYYDADIIVSLSLVFMAVVGTHFSVFLKFKGGMATTLLLFALLVLSPFSLLAFAAGAVILLFTIRKSAVTALGSHILLPLELFLIEQSIPFVIFGVLIAVLYCVRYRPVRSDYSYYVKGSSRLLPRTGSQYLIPLSGAGEPSLVGSKAHNLYFLYKAGFRVPKTFICTFRAFDDHSDGVPGINTLLQEELQQLLDVEKGYCVRSSASMEDDASHSFAGQYDSYLDIHSAANITGAIESVWNSLAGNRADTYRDRTRLTAEDIKMAVIIQETIPAILSGVVFTRNPVSDMDEIIIEAVPGFGDVLVQAGVTPDRWVYKWGNWLETPQQQETVPEVITQIVQLSKRIASKFGKPVDLEWAYDGKELYWLQLREITTLKNVNIYSNRISKEFLPGIIKPLVWSVNIPVVNTSWKKLLVKLVGNAARGIDIENLARSFYYRAYFNMGVVGELFGLLGMPRETIEILIGITVPGKDAPKFRPGWKTIKYLPRMTLFVMQNILSLFRLETRINTRRNVFNSYRTTDIDTLNEVETVSRIEGLMQASSETSYDLIITRLLSGLTNKLLERLLPDLDLPIESIGSNQEKAALRDIDIQHHLSQLNSIYRILPKNIRERAQYTPFHELGTIPELHEFHSGIERFLYVFGHLSESGNDFSRTTWLETPELVIGMVTGYQASSTQQRYQEKTNIYNESIAKRALIRLVRKRIIGLRISMERINYLYGFGYALIRPYMLHMAELFQKAGIINERDDIYYLTLDEVRDIAATGSANTTVTADLLRRKNDISRYKEIDLPDIIVGDSPPPAFPRSAVSRKLSGTATAKGYCEGPVKVVRGIEEFNKTRKGDIVVIPFSDVSWTPFLSEVKGIISASGGMLSHCAVVAREYGIPAVVSVPGALDLQDGTFVTLDGFKGEIVILQR